jgi:1-deoxy-D-xylulose-5-phosphate reductoisomerase
MSRRVIILGSTGSIGQNALRVLEKLQPEWRVVGLGARSSWSKLGQQANRWRPEAVAIADGGHAADLEKSLPEGVQFFSGDDSLIELVESTECDCVVCAVVGVAGLPATLRAVELGRHVAIANKEVLVVAGSLIMEEAARSGAKLTPIDSEHSAIYQAMLAGRREDVERVFLTASGGPFRTWSREQIASATLEDALNHPTWDMGPKVTIDCASMTNKALEIIEARWLFDLRSDQIEVVVHPESIIHSMVEFCDGSVVAQLGTPDMCTPIQYALTAPQRRPCPSDRLDLFALGSMHFERPDLQRFPALRLGHEVATRGGTSGAVFNAANEAAVELFRQGEIGFCEIVERTAAVLERHEFVERPTLKELLAADRWARNEVKRCLTV